MLYKEYTSCRLCQGDLEDVLDLGDICLSTFPEDRSFEVPKAPLVLARCVLCDLYQLRHSVDPNILYAQYWYQSGLNRSMRVALQNVVANTLIRCPIQDGDIIVDIGANDGTLLKQYPRLDIVRVAYEPCSVGDLLTTDAADIIFRDYFSADLYHETFRKKAKIVTACAMFYDLDDPVTFLRGVKSILAEDGVFVIQQTDLKSVIQTNDFPYLCHEHVCCYSLDRLQKLLFDNGLEIFDLEYNGVNGGSLRTYAKHNEHKRKIEETVPIALVDEWEYFASLGDKAKRFRTNVVHIATCLKAFIAGLNATGYRVAALGASTKGNTLLQYCGLDASFIHHIADINPDKFGKRTVGTHIPIISEAESLALKPDYYLILPWGFTPFFVEHMQSYLRDGGMLISPLPKPRVIYMSYVGEDEAITEEPI